MSHVMTERNQSQKIRPIFGDEDLIRLGLLPIYCGNQILNLVYHPKGMLKAGMGCSGVYPVDNAELADETETL